MRMIELDPPGTLCQNQAVLDLVRASRAQSFCEVGVGTGSLSLALCRNGLRGVGVELSAAAAAVARQRLPGDFHLIEGDFMSMPPPGETFDLALSMMVMEHIKDDAAFARRLASLVRPGGTVILGVPARMDRWGVEDEAAGHFRRYERGDVERVMAAAGLENVAIRSVSVPAANITFHLSNLLVRSAWARRRSLSQQERTELSGLHDVPFKTMFPAAFKLVLNPVAMYPLFVLQRAFYGTDWGLTIVASGKRPAQDATRNSVTAETTLSRSSGLSRL